MLISSFLTISFLIVASHQTPTVKIENGEVTGIELTSHKGQTFNAYLGIPYAKAPVGALRFKNPVPADPLSGTYKANKDPNLCIQRNDYFYDPNIVGEEDCLYLNIYTPKSGQKLSVMVYIHGGGWIAGNGNRDLYGPEYLMDHDIILVTMNYRLGPLGFLSTEDGVSPGNYGLKDQQLALKWVQKYIKYFGGNPDSVTLFGQSAGAASTNYHMLSKGSRGLFHRAIPHSGSAFTQWASYFKGDSRKIAFEFGKEFGCSTQDSESLIKCLNQQDARALIDKSNYVYEFDYDPMIPFRPVVEPESEGAFLTENPIQLYENGDVADVPLMTGFTKNEGGIRSSCVLTSDKLFERLSQNIDEIFPITFLYHHTCSNPELVTKAVHKQYFNNGQINKSAAHKQQLIDAYSDALINIGVDFQARLQLQYLKQPVYYYVFSYKGALSTTMASDPENNHGVSHSDDLLYLFKFPEELFQGKSMNEKDLEMIDFLTTTWTNFAKTGVPLGSNWKPTSLPDVPMFEIQGPNEIATLGKDSSISKRLDFWYRLPFNTKIHNKIFELKKLHKDEL